MEAVRLQGKQLTLWDNALYSLQVGVCLALFSTLLQPCVIVLTFANPPPPPPPSLSDAKRRRRLRRRRLSVRSGARLTPARSPVYVMPRLRAQVADAARADMQRLRSQAGAAPKKS